MVLKPNPFQKQKPVFSLRTVICEFFQKNLSTPGAIHFQKAKFLQSGFVHKFMITCAMIHDCIMRTLFFRTTHLFLLKNIMMLCIIPLWYGYCEYDFTLFGKKHII